MERNKKMKKIEIVSAVVLVGILCMSYLHFQTDVVAQSGTDTDTADLKNSIQTFFTALDAQPGSLDAYQTAYRILLAGQQAQDKDIPEMADKTDEMIKGGNRWRSEFLDSKTVGNDLIQFRYLYKCDTHPIVWYFTFYRSQVGSRIGDISPAQRKWICLSIRFDNDLDSLFQHWSKTSP